MGIFFKNLICLSEKRSTRRSCSERVLYYMYNIQLPWDGHAFRSAGQVCYAWIQVQSLTDWLTDRLTDWSVDRWSMVDRSIDRFIDLPSQLFITTYREQQFSLVFGPTIGNLTLRNGHLASEFRNLRFWNSTSICVIKIKKIYMPSSKVLLRSASC